MLYIYPVAAVALLWARCGKQAFAPHKNPMGETSPGLSVLVSVASQSIGDHRAVVHVCYKSHGPQWRKVTAPTMGKSIQLLKGVVGQLIGPLIADK